MAEPLQNKALFRTLHIALFFFVILITKNSYAQSLLLPGDVVFVSINSTSDEFELIPLIDLESGTEFSINNGVWNKNELTFEDGNELNIVIEKRVEAGTPLKFNALNSAFFSKKGLLKLSPEREHLFIYQKVEEQYRFLYAIGWGENEGKKNRNFFGSDIPEVLNENRNALLRLGSNNNYQYYLRNGASGTKKMLLSFVSNAGNWRGNEEAGFPEFGTSFNLLTPPVILFDESLTSVKENSNKTILNVAIYEHDGSKLTVDVAFDSAFSSLGREEIDGFRSQKINFTGLIGDGVYEVEIPLKDDKQFEGLESGIFSLQNLSSGRFGDFISHTVLVSDDEIPELKLELQQDLDENILLIHNLESKELDLKNWELVRGNVRVIFPRNTFLGVGETLVVYEASKSDPESTSNSHFLLDEEESQIFASSGVIQLRNNESSKVSEIQISNGEQVESQSLISENRINSKTSSGTSSDAISQQNSIANKINPGWKALRSSDISFDEFTSTELYYWDVKEARFKNLENKNSDLSHVVLVGYFDNEASEKLNKSKVKDVEPDEFLNITIESIDVDENGLLQSSEGLNLVKNNTSTAFSAKQLIRVLEEKLELQGKISVYKSPLNFESVSKLDDDGLIFSDEVFWLKFNTELNRREISIDPEELKKLEVAEETIEKGFLEFELTGRNSTSNLMITFIPEEIKLDNSLNLKLNEELYLSEFSELVITANVSENNYDRFEISNNSANISSLPLNISSSKSGELELKVKEWTNIPDGWVIMLEDTKEEKTHEIHENWSLKFNYSNLSTVQEDKVILPTVDDRFRLKVVPKELVVQEEKDLPVNVELHQNYPNPFNPTTVISFYMPEEGLIKLSVFNIVGQPVAVLLNETRAQGEHSYEWDASDMPSGIYIYQLEVGSKIMTRKMTLVK